MICATYDVSCLISHRSIDWACIEFSPFQKLNHRLGLNMPGAWSSSLCCHMVCATRSTTPSHHSLLIIYIHYIYFEIENCSRSFFPFFADQINFRNSLDIGKNHEVESSMCLGSCLHWTTQVSPKIAGNTDHPSRHKTKWIHLIKTFLHLRLSLHFREHP